MNKKNKSFTLIELLVVIVIIGILAGVIMISTSSSIDKANFAKAQAFSSTIQNELLSNLVSEWTFDEPQEGNVTKDSWGNNHGTIAGALHVDNCVFGKCYSFDGDDYIDCGKGFDELSINKKHSISLWLRVNSDELNGRTVITKNFSNIDRVAIMFREGEIKTGIYNGASYIYRSSGKINLNQWYYVTYTYNLSSISLFINGVLQKGSSNPWTCSGDNLIIGSDSAHGAKFFDGLIDDIRIYNAALTSSQIKQNYIAGLNSMLSNGNISKQEYNERINALAYDNE